MPALRATAVRVRQFLDLRKRAKRGIPQTLGVFLNYPEERTTASPKAEIEDLRAWYLHRTVAGLASAAPGYRHLNIRPHPGSGLTSASARHSTPYGMAESSWQIKQELIEVEVMIPPNATATVTLPGSDRPPIEVGSGTHHWFYSYWRPDVAQPQRSHRRIPS